MNIDPFSNSKSLAEWSATQLQRRGLDEVADWRMLEYWFQVEIYRSVQAGLAGQWHHIGNYEQPYHTEFPRSGSKTKTKWIDLVFARPNPDNPEAVVWVELKDVGRNEKTAANNVKGLGDDLAALRAMKITATKELWLQPQPQSMDRGRLEEWNKYGQSIDCGKQLIAQIVISPKSMEYMLSAEEIKSTWLQSFISKVGDIAPHESFEIGHHETEKFVVFGLVADLYCDG